MIELELPYPPTINHYYGQRRTGGKFIKPAGKVFRLGVLQAAIEKRACKYIETDIELEIDAYPPDNRRRDLDNINKALLDALEAANVFKDDSQIVKMTSTKFAPVKNGRVIVRILQQKAV